MGFPLKGLPQVLAFCYVLTYSCMYAGRFVSNVAAPLVRGFFPTAGFEGFRATVISSELLTDLLAPTGEALLLEPMAQARLQALVDAVPVALMEFRLVGGRLQLLAANAAARRMPGLGAVRNPGVDASEVFDLLANTQLLDQLHGVVRVGAQLECRQVVREPGRLLLAWDLSARRVTNDCIVITVRDATEAETLRVALAATERALEEVRRELKKRKFRFMACSCFSVYAFSDPC